ncbi:biotin--[acetyl-CoA-carboxylase] ligase [Arsenicibacter rosenii]|uniref:Biotin--[acetyl-CoA-carboxylase] ligase n=1 Tax=Arsenicibacter rosenii TaxID=1750698 RepID=A0A1S2VPZ0_9BACT|nr:biotin--[acetyl-CoA-carboxylase] ligase [Arsenicibacter rosenii]OIN60843.1 biotin--[acetyl-CoA-carboxylase] ligase [Arsenicibacter rosenii]
MYKIHPKTLFVGQKIHYLPSCQSTNDEAAQIIASDEPAEGLIVITDAQLAGRGQRGNVWQAESGQNLTMSVILRPSFLSATEQFWLNMAVSLGITDALESFTEGLLRIKWPNDIYVENTKTGGILIENTLQGAGIACSVIGIGLNVNQVQFIYPSATSLQKRFPMPDGYSLPSLLTTIAERLEQRYLQLRAGKRADLKTAYLQRLFRYQEEHWFEREDEQGYWQRFRGYIVGIDETGRLAIATDNRIHYFGFKEVSFVI